MQQSRLDRLAAYLPLLLIPPLIAFIVILADSAAPSVSKGERFSDAQATSIRRTNTLLAGLPQNGAALGNPAAPVTLQFFGDLQCSESRQVMLGALPFLIRHWVRAGKLRIVYRSRESDTLDWSEFREQQIAAMAAGMQGKMWAFVDLFYREQGPEFTHYATEEFLERIAKQAGMQLGLWTEDRESDEWERQIESGEMTADAKGLLSTPTFLIGLTGREAVPLRHVTLEDPKVFDEAIRELLQA